MEEDGSEDEEEEGEAEETGGLDDEDEVNLEFVVDVVGEGESDAVEAAEEVEVGEAEDDVDGDAVASLLSNKSAAAAAAAASSSGRAKSRKGQSNAAPSLYKFRQKSFFSDAVLMISKPTSPPNVDARQCLGLQIGFAIKPVKKMMSERELDF